MTTLETHRYHEADEARSPVAVLAFLVALAAGLVVLLAGPLSRIGLWDFRTGFSLLKYGSWLALAGAALGVVGAARTKPIGKRRGTGFAVLAVVLGLVTAYFPWSFRHKAQGAPPIHDITTDTANPPPFVAVLPLRADAPNPAEYGGDSIAQQQRAAYPDVLPIIIEEPADRAFGVALETARDMGWEIVAADAAEGRIEATDTTFWFGFRDDVVVRIMPLNGRSVIDVRSVSRVGRGDAGKNADRIREYIERLRGGE